MPAEPRRRIPPRISRRTGADGLPSYQVGTPSGVASHRLPTPFLHPRRDTLTARPGAASDWPAHSPEACDLPAVSAFSETPRFQQLALPRRLFPATTVARLLVMLVRSRFLQNTALHSQLLEAAQRRVDTLTGLHDHLCQMLSVLSCGRAAKTCAAGAIPLRLQYTAIRRIPRVEEQFLQQHGRDRRHIPSVRQFAFGSNRDTHGCGPRSSDSLRNQPEAAIMWAPRRFPSPPGGSERSYPGSSPAGDGLPYRQRSRFGAEQQQRPQPR